MLVARMPYFPNLSGSVSLTMYPQMRRQLEGEHPCTGSQWGRGISQVLVTFAYRCSLLVSHTDDMDMFLVRAWSLQNSQLDKECVPILRVVVVAASRCAVIRGMSTANPNQQCCDTLEKTYIDRAGLVAWRLAFHRLSNSRVVNLLKLLFQSLIAFSNCS